MGTYFVATTTLETIECCKCHILFAVPKDFNDEQLRRKEDGEFYCPNGHAQHYIGECEESRLKRQLRDEQQCCIAAREETNRIERKLWGTRGWAKKLEKKVKSA